MGVNSGSFDKDRVVIVGGGVIGLCSAYHCLKSGLPVTVIDQHQPSDSGCSYGNAGMVVPSHFIPLAAPGMISKGLKWLANPEGPFYIRPRASMELMRWCKIFMAHATDKHVRESRELLRDLNLESRRIFVGMAKDAGCKLEEKGLLMLCNTDKGLDEEAEVAGMADELGVQAEVCSPERLKELDPGIEMDVKGGVWFKQDCHMDPASFMHGLRKKVVEMGAEMVTDARVTALHRGSAGTVSLDGVNIPPGLQIVLACGSWSGDLLKTLGRRLPMQAGKGYSLTLDRPTQLPELCSILCEAKVAVTPMGAHLRFAGTMEICGNDISVNPRRVRGIVRSAQKYFPRLKQGDFEGLKPWVGLRPCSPDGLPYIGRVSGYSNLTVATGHSMMGLSMGPVTGMLVSEIVADGQPLLDITKLAPLRFG
ncbi:MAG: FAD-dependent oxidoreductase [Verrucomicrobiae bacterium]|nr:FAD-dependent oxidoreductase [Verrucomicrobiae bacterium]NNJ86554.1 FAD-dependent oxidoreductase [Akkermansiaceae bacterium]